MLGKQNKNVNFILQHQKTLRKIKRQCIIDLQKKKRSSACDLAGIHKVDDEIITLPDGGRKG